MTYEELIEKGSKDDPIIDPNRPAQITPEGLFIPGPNNDTDYALDMLIRIEEGGFRIWVRDPERDPSATDNPEWAEPWLGREWCHEAFFDNYEDMLDWIYDW